MENGLRIAFAGGAFQSDDKKQPLDDAEIEGGENGDKQYRAQFDSNDLAQITTAAQKQGGVDVLVNEFIYTILIFYIILNSLLFQTCSSPPTGRR